MISYIKGLLEYKDRGIIIIDNNGIGYTVNISDDTLGKLPPLGTEIKIYTYMSVKEDSISLFGFLSIDELNMFNKLITVSGVGPKGALSILASMSPDKIILAIITDDVKALSMGQGIGKKTAQRIALELKDKVNIENAVPNTVDNIEIMHSEGNDKIEINDAVDALTSLGFSRSEAFKAVMDINPNEMDSSQIIKSALKKLSK